MLNKDPVYTFTAVMGEANCGAQDISCHLRTARPPIALS